MANHMSDVTGCLEAMTVEELRVVYCRCAAELGMKPGVLARYEANDRQTPVFQTASVVWKVWDDKRAFRDTGKRVSGPPRAHGGSRTVDAVYDCDYSECCAAMTRVFAGLTGPTLIED